MPSVRVNRKAADRIASGHVWIFSSDVISSGDAGAGDAVRVVDPKGRVHKTTHNNTSSQIALRLLSSRLEPIDSDFLRRRLEAAREYRERFVRGSDAYRLIHAEGDFLPGLIVDRYADWLVVQLLDQGMDRMREHIVAALVDVIHPRGILARNDVAVRAKENLPQEKTVLFGEIPERVEFSMNGLRLGADLMGGQKTGVFLDQRENYQAVSRYARGQALDCFTGSGGFALHMASRCDSVEAIDSSESALANLKGNSDRNGIQNVVRQKADVLEYLPGLVQARRQFDIVVVDPPAFT